MSSTTLNNYMDFVTNSHDSITQLNRYSSNQMDGRLPRLDIIGFNFANIGIQPKLKISQPNDAYEQEADRVAERVMRMPTPSVSITSMGDTKDEGIARKCAACEMKEDEDEKQLNISRKPSTASNLDVNNGIVDNIDKFRSKSSSISLDTNTQEFMESRFGYDFSNIRIHTDEVAVHLSSLLSAEAFTMGNHIYFSQGRYSPHSMSGRFLLAHELSHTLQQGANNAPTSMQQSLTAYRKVKVNNPSGMPAGAPTGETNEKIVKSYVTTLCSDFTVTGGRVEPNDPSLCPPTVASESCGCLCEMHSLADTWTIDVNDNDWPHTDDSTSTVTVHSPFSGVRFGAWTVSSARREEPNWLVLGHELCGHAKLFARGTHPTGPPPTRMGRPSHDVTVEIENKIAKEHGIPAAELRGLFADPHHGESLAKVTVAQFPLNSSDVHSLPLEEKRKIDVAEAFVRSAPVKMDVIGHADQTGSASINATISENRARKVKSELEGRGISSTRFLVTRGNASAECTSSGDQPLCRKVDIFMYIFEGASERNP